MLYQLDWSIKNDKKTDVAEEEKGIDAKARGVTGARECRAYGVIGGL